MSGRMIDDGEDKFFDDYDYDFWFLIFDFWYDFLIGTKAIKNVRPRKPP